jgi:hypothetical protein
VSVLEPIRRTQRESSVLAPATCGIRGLVRIVMNRDRLSFQVSLNLQCLLIRIEVPLISACLDITSFQVQILVNCRTVSMKRSFVWTPLRSAIRLDPMRWANFLPDCAGSIAKVASAVQQRERPAKRNQSVATYVGQRVGRDLPRAYRSS